MDVRLQPPPGGGTSACPLRYAGMMRRFRQAIAIRRERRWRVQRESEEDESDREEIILCVGDRDNEAPKRKPACR